MSTIPGTPRFARPARSTFPEEICANDSRIMLQMLLTEARRYHAVAARHSKRKPPTPAVVTPSSTPSEYDRQAMDGDSESWHLITSVECSSDHGNEIPLALDDSTFLPPTDVSNDAASSTESDDAAEYDAWADLQSQVEDAWKGPGEVSHAARYNRIKSYLTWMFIWDASREWSDFEEISAQASLQWIQRRQVARLRQLRHGELFIRDDAVSCPDE